MTKQTSVCLDFKCRKFAIQSGFTVEHVLFKVQYNDHHGFWFWLKKIMFLVGFSAKLAT